MVDVVKATVMTDPISLKTEDDLVQLCRSGDEEAMKMLYNQQSGRLYTLALRFLGDRAEAEEVVQDTFLKAWRKMSSFRGDSAISTWLYRIAVNLCRDRVKKQRPLVKEREESTLPAMPDTFARKRMNAALLELSAGYREVLVMHDVMEMKHPQIAEVLGIAVGTSKSQLHKARGQMRQLLKRENVFATN